MLTVVYSRVPATLQAVLRYGRQVLEEEERRKHELYQAIRNRSLEQQRRKREKEQDMLARHTAQYEREQQLELRRARRMESRIARMEAMEKDLIRQLRSTQVRQVEAYADLEEVITEPLPYSGSDEEPDAGNTGMHHQEAYDRASPRPGSTTEHGREAWGDEHSADSDEFGPPYNTASQQRYLKPSPPPRARGAVRARRASPRHRSRQVATNTA